MQNLITKTDESLITKKLREEIKVKEKKLVDLTHKVEQLRIDIVIVRQEYNAKVGKLYLQLDQLDLDIIKQLQLRKLISQGYTVEQAHKILNTETQNQQEKINKQKESFNKDLEEQKSAFELSDEEELELKILYKKLVKKFHPDLTLDIKEKDERGKKMQKINDAYKKKDLERLKSLEHDYDHPLDKELSPEVLQQLLDEINKGINRLKNEYEALTKTEWFEFNTKLRSARKNKRDLFIELEEKLLRDIAKKRTKLDELSSLINKNEKE